MERLIRYLNEAWIFRITTSETPMSSKADIPDVCEAHYIPNQVDNAATTSPQTAQNNPMALLWRDIRTLYSVIYLLPTLFMPFRSKRESDELSLQGWNLVNLFILTSVTLVEAITLVLAISLILLPGLVGIPVLYLLLFFFRLMSASLRNAEMLYSTTDNHRIKYPSLRTTERWIFVNGMLQSYYGLQQNCDRLAQIFGRPILGIHNRTYGLFGDLLECIIQRSFSYNNYCTRFTYDHVKAFLLDSKIDKVVLIGHSQGGITLSMALDLLYVDVPAEIVAKLEVYTFGSAASHFNSPLRAPNNIFTSGTPIVPHIEHYINDQDLVPRWGVLYGSRKADNRYAGKIFIRMNATGHMLNQHYLNDMFPLPEGGEDSKEANFLDQIAKVDKETLEVRNPFTARKSNIPSGLFSSSRNNPYKNYKPIACPTMSAPTVRDLSRLWRYMGGKDPDWQPTLGMAVSPAA